MIIRKLLKIAAKKLVENGAVAAGTKIGEAIGGRIGAKIYTPPTPPKTPKDEDE